MNNDVAILVVSFDGYSDVWPVFFKCKDIYWNNCPYNTYLVTNHKNYERCNSVIKTGDETNWCDRLSLALKDVHEDIVVLLLEDYLIGEEVSTSEVKKYISFFVKKKANYLRLVNIPTKHKHNKKDCTYKILQNEEYGINLQPAIWKKEYLINILNRVQGNRSAWEFEIHLLRKCNSSANPIEGCYGTKDNVLFIHNGILQGKWFKKEVKYFNSRGITIDTSQRDVLPDRDYYAYILKRIIRENIPPRIRKVLKKILIKIGFTFVSNE